MSEYLPQILLALSIQFVGVWSPGPSVMLILGVATSQGRLPSLVTAFGVACGSVVLSTATVLGITALLAQMADVMTLIRFVGAVYLLWLAFKAFRTAALAPKLVIEPAQSMSSLQAGLSGFILQVTNPKAIFFWLAIAAVGGVGDAPLPIVILFITGAFLNSFIGHGGYALILSSGPVRRTYFRFRRWIEGTLGFVFVFAAYKLITAKN